jgi:hypothetical protein
MANVLFGINIDNMAAFDNAYWASKDPAVAALRPMTDPTARATAAFQLAQAGEIIDKNIDALGMSPYLMMLQRQAVDGDVWVPSGLQGQPTNPQDMQKGPVPAGAIKVSTDPADFPPFAPAPPPIPVSTSPIGPDLGFTIGGKEAFSASATDPLPGGYKYQAADGSVYIKVALGNSLMDATKLVYVWEKQ